MRRPDRGQPRPLGQETANQLSVYQGPSVLGASLLPCRPFVLFVTPVPHTAGQAGPAGLTPSRLRPFALCAKPTLPAQRLAGPGSQLLQGRILLVLCAKPTPLVAGPQGLGSALAGIDLLSLCTLPAFHIAAPADLALAGPCHHTALCVVATATTNTLTVLLSVTPAACRARGKSASQAEAGRVVQVYQLWCSG